MNDPHALALEATRRLRRSAGYGGLGPAERATLDRDLGRIEAALSRDPYARMLGDELPIPPGVLGPSAPAQASPPPPPPPPPQPMTAPGPVSRIGAQGAEALAALDFPSFVAGLVQGVFQAIVDATTQQVREYANLVASLSKTAEQFTADHVTANQARDDLAGRYPTDLRVELPSPGTAGEPRLRVRPGREGTQPVWLAEYDLEGSELSDELVETQLVDRARRRVGDERIQMLATTVLMGINRIVVNDGSVKARMQFHAQARERTTAELLQGMQGAQSGIVGRATGAAATMLVSTVAANAQSDASIRADLMGEVRVSFRTETFDLNNFANTQAIQLINRHARWNGSQTPQANPAAPLTRPEEGS